MGPGKGKGGCGGGEMPKIIIGSRMSGRGIWPLHFGNVLWLDFSHCKSLMCESKHVDVMIDSRGVQRDMVLTF